ncbi:MAG: hypothetical protein ACLT76_18340 [Clostridium fessum]
MEKAEETSQLEVNISIDLIPPVSRPVVFLYPREVEVHHLECLIQGDNKPIILEFDENIANIEQISAVLYGDQKEYKRWDEKSAVMENDEIQLRIIPGRNDRNRQRLCKTGNKAGFKRDNRVL